nr:penicillin-binding transpeptidase domain-containing protein [Moraxella sp. CTOTU46711]
MTENQIPKDENSQETMNSGDLETVNNTGSDTLSQDKNVADSVDVEQIATPANTSDNTQASETKNTNKKIKNDGKVASFRVSQALYKTILTNLQVILVVFVVGLIGWLAWYLSPLTASNTTYNAEANENAVSLVVDNLGMADVVNQANSQNTNTQSANANLSSSVNATPAKTCDLTQPKNQARFTDSINRVNQSLLSLYQQKRLANQYQLQTASLWQQACEQHINEDELAFALKTLASPERLLQLQWREQQPNRRNQNDPNVAHMPTNWLTQTNPWYGLPGCVYIKTAKTADNQTGYLYVDNRSNTTDTGDVDPLTQLCNNPRLIPMSVKSLAVKPLTGAATLPNAPASDPNNAFNKTKNDIQNQANGVLQTLQDKPTQDPKKRIASTSKTEVALPTNLGLMYSELSNIHASHFDRQLLDAYQSYQQKNDQRSWWQKLTAPPINSINVDGSDIKIGYNMALTLNPAVQTTAQQVADCVTNNPNGADCNSVLSPALQKVANGMYENALVRSIGIAVIDVKTQGVLALASADSNCYRADNGDTTIKPTGCPILWKKDWSKQNLMNHALYQTVYPGSTVKTVQALALVRANPRFKNMQTPEARYLKQVIASSSTEKVANFLYCQRTTSAMSLQRDRQGVCPGMPAFKKASDDMGWSVNCADKGGVNCGFKDLLFGKAYNSDPMLQSRYFSGVLLTDGKQDYTTKQLQFTESQVASCVKANGGRMNGACRQGGDMLNASMNQVFGAGNAKTSVLGVSDMFANLLIADNGATQRRGVHLIEDLWGVNQIPLRPKAWRGDAQSQETMTTATSQLGAMPLGINQSDARGALNLLSGTLLAGTGLGGGNGTAFTACNQAIGSCTWTQGVIVGKTGTPGFNYPTSQNGRSFYTPNVTVSMVANLCNNADIRAGKAQPSVACYARPYKWFVYGLKDKNGKWDKAVAVLVERNWTKNGLVDDPRDGINRAVQAGMILAKQMYQSSAISHPTSANPWADSVASPVTDTTQAVKKTQTYQ